MMKLMENMMGLMDTRTMERIAIGTSVTANCMPCLRFHLERAREAGLEDADNDAAVRVGRVVRKGAASVCDEEATTLLGAVGEEEYIGCQHE